MEESKDTDSVPFKEETRTRKTWETPKLRILPVPGKTQGGGGDVNDQDDIFYKKS
jgi:hypothetical protein